MIIIEIAEGQPKITDWDVLGYEAISTFLGGRIEGLSISSDANSVIIYAHALASERFEAENFRLESGRIVRGPALIVGIGQAGEDRGLTNEELEAIDLWSHPNYHIPTLRWAPEQ
jgi:hypothetical protein